MSMSFIEIPSEDQEPSESEPEPPVWSGPPAGVLPGFSAQRAVLARTDDVLLSVDRLLVYSNGVVFTLMLMRREDRDDFGPVPGMLGRRPRPDLPSDFLRLGILFGDGSKWTNLEGRYPDEESEVSGPVVVAQGGGGGGKLWQTSFWVWPLPPPGRLAFVVSWPAEGIEEQMVELDADEIRERAVDAEQVWPTSP